MQSYNRAYNTFTELWLHNRKTQSKDWHFNEFEIVMKGKKLQLPMIDIEGIEQHSDNIYCCKCHWSVVKLIMN